MASRLVRWFTFTVLFALLPLGVTVLLGKLTGTFTIRVLQDSPEILFFALMICATSLGDIQALRSAVGDDLPLLIMWSALLLGAVFAAILYGSLAYHKLLPNGIPNFQENLFYVSLSVAVTFFVLALLVQVLLSRIDKVK